MKKFIFLIMAATLVLGSSCKKTGSWFGKSSKQQEEIALLTKKNNELNQQIRDDSVRYAAELAKMRNSYESKLVDLQKEEEAGTAPATNTYYVIVGSFKNIKYAENYSSKVKSLGHEGKIIQGPNNFQLVTYGTYGTLKNSFPALKNARESVATESWIYFTR
jgi:cell division protein FtsN